MSPLRFFYALIAGGALMCWLFFLLVAGGMAGEVYWSGYNNGHFLPGYLVSLYLPPVMIAFFSFLSLRRTGKVHD